MSKCSILMVTSHYRQFGGVESVMNNLCQGLDKLGYNTAIGAYSFAKSPPNIEKINLKRISTLSSDINGFHFDIIHSHQPRMNYYSLFTSKPFVFHWHGSSSKIQDLNFQISMLLCKNRLSKIISISYAALEQLRNLAGGLSSDVIYNGIDTSYYHTNLSRPYVKGEPQLLFVGNLYPHKNVKRIIEAMPEIMKFYPNAHLQIVGEGEDHLALKREIIIRKLENNVDLVGGVSQEELRLRYSSCDVYVSASKWEMFGLPLLEAMACGKPVVVSDITAHQEILEASKAGLSFSDKSSISKTVQEVYEKKNIFGLSTRKFAEKYDWSNICKQIADTYERILFQN